MQDPTLLFVSDCPETFVDHGRLFHAPLLTDGSVARLLVDHVNGTPNPMRVLVGLANTGMGPKSVRLLQASGGPDQNYMSVGHAATFRFLRVHEINVDSNAIPKAIGAGETLIVADAVLRPNDCVAVILDVDPGGAGSSLEFRVIACDPIHDDFGVYAILPESPDDGKHRRGCFVISGSEAAQTIAYSGMATSFEIGANGSTYARSPSDPYAGPPHSGEYGVFKRFNCSLSGVAGAALYQSARGGGATASYCINGTFLASHAIAPGSQSKIQTYTLVNGKPIAIALSTMPEINSSYPLQLTFDVDDPTIAGAGSPTSPVYSA